MASNPRTQLRTQQLTGSLPISTGSAHVAAPALTNTQEVLDELASSLRRVIDYDTTGTGFFEAPQTFRSMGTESRFVATNDLYVSGTTYATKVTGSGGLELVASDNGAVIIDGDSGATFSEDGTEVFIIDADGDSRFASSGGSADDPDVEIDGYLRLDTDFASSGSLNFIGTATRADVAKLTSGDLVLSSAAGDVFLVDNNVGGSTWSDADKGVPLSTSTAQWTAFANLGFNSLLDALTSAGAQNKISGSINTAVAAGDPVGLSFDVSNIPSSERMTRIDFYVNGVLQRSGSDAERQSGDADYILDLAGGESDADIIYGEQLVLDDTVTVVLR